MAIDPVPTHGAPGAALSSEEVARRFQEAAGILWTVAAGVLADRTAVEDVLQEAAVIALEKRNQYQPGTRLVAWLARITHYTALNHARRRRRHGPTGAEAQVLEAQPAPPAGDTPGGEPDLSPGGMLAEDQRHFDDEVQAALEGLEPTRRACLLLRVLRGLDYREISELLDIPEGTAMSHVHRARAALRASLAGREEPQIGAEGGTR